MITLADIIRVGVQQEQEQEQEQEYRERRLAFEQAGYGVNKPAAWRRLYGAAWGYYRDFGWRAAFLGEGVSD
jgi:hypothetical protein